MDPTGEFVVVANTVTAGNTDNWGIYTLSLRADQVLHLFFITLKTRVE